MNKLLIAVALTAALATPALAAIQKAEPMWRALANAAWHQTPSSGRSTVPCPFRPAFTTSSGVSPWLKTRTLAPDPV